MFHFLQMDASHNSLNCSNAWRLSCVYPWPRAYFGWLSTRDLCLMRKRVNLLDWLVRWKNDSRVKLQTIGVAECVSVILDGEIGVGWGGSDVRLMGVFLTLSFTGRCVDIYRSQSHQFILRFILCPFPRPVYPVSIPLVVLLENWKVVEIE